MRNRKKLLLTCLGVAALAACSILGTLAYLTDTDSVVNTFTAGRVQITVDESLVSPDGTALADAQRVKANEYHLLPGMCYTKDPTLTVEKGSEDAYVRMLLTVHNAKAVQALIDRHQLGDFSALIGGWDKNTWLYEGFTEDTQKDTISFEFRYKEIVRGSETEAVMLPPLFTQLLVPGPVTGEELQELQTGGFRLEVFGHAIQAAGFADVSDEQGSLLMTAEEAAWAAFAAQHSTPAPSSSPPADIQPPLTTEN